MQIAKYIAKILGILLLLLLIVFGGVTYYVYRNQEPLLRYVVNELTGKLNGKLTIGKTNPDFFRTFPHACITLHNVQLTDSLFTVHRKPLLHAGTVRVTVNLFSLLRHHPQIREVSLANGTIYWYTDSNGYSNKSVLIGKRDTAHKMLHIKKILLSQMQFISDNRQKHKYIQLHASKIFAHLNYADTGWHAKVHFKVLVHQLTLNEAKGSLLQHQSLSGVLSVTGNTINGTLAIERQNIRIGQSTVNIAAHLNSSTFPATYAIKIATKNQPYDTLLNWLTPVSATRLKRIGVTGIFSVDAQVLGRVRYPDTPAVTVQWQTADATIVTPLVQFGNCRFSGSYNNGIATGYYNPVVHINNWQGMWHGILLQSQLIKVTNLQQPIVDAGFSANFPIEKLGFLANGTGFRPDKGMATLQIQVHAAAAGSTGTQQMPLINGRIALRNFGVTYLPRKYSFAGSNAVFVFHDNSLLVQQANLSAAGTQLTVKGQVPGFLSYLFTAPQTLKSTWSIESPSVNLETVIPFIAAKTYTNLPDTTHVVPLARQLGKFLSACTMQLTLSSPEVFYKSFKAGMVHGNVSLAGTGITVSNITMMHAGGSVVLNGHLAPTGDVSNYHLSVDARMVDIRRFFTAFNNFGQDAITNNNLEGALSASIQIHGGLNAAGAILPHSITGTAQYRIDEGKLIRFDPILHLGKRIFRRRNLDTVSFHHLAGHLSVQKKTISFPATFIESSALNLQMEGRYVIGGMGTDIKLEVPLRNPKKDELILNDEIRHKRNMKGIVLHLRAIGTEDGSVKMKWNNMDENED